MFWLRKVARHPEDVTSIFFYCAVFILYIIGGGGRKTVLSLSDLRFYISGDNFYNPGLKMIEILPQIVI